MRILLLTLLLAALITPARAVQTQDVASLSLSASLTRAEVRPGDAVSLTIAVFGDGLVTVRQSIDGRLTLTRMEASTGEIGVASDGAVVWSGDTFPALIVLTLQAKADAPPGDLTLTAVATDDAGHTASSSATLRICCAEWPPPDRPHLYLPVWRA